MYGFTRAEEIVGRRLGDFILRSDPKNIELLRSFIRSGYRLSDAESREIDREGNPRDFLNNLIGIVENGLWVRTWGTQRDITERKRAEEAIEREARVNASLIEVSKAINSTLNLNQLLDLIVEKVLELTDSKHGGLFLLDETGEILRMQAWRGFSPETAALVTFKKGESIAGWVAETGEGMLLHDVQTHPRFKNVTQIERLSSMITVPLIAKEKVIGTLGIDRFEGEKPFTDSEFRIAQSFAEQAALAIGNSRLFEESKTREETLRQQFAHLEAVHKLAETVSRAEALEVVYEEALTTLERTLGATRASILLFDPDGVIRFKASHGLSEKYKKAVEGHSPWGPSDRNPQPILISNVAEATELGHLQEVILAEGIKALAFVPLVHQDRLLGKFMLYYDTPRSLSDHELHWTQTVAHDIAFAVARMLSNQALQRSEALLTKAQRIARLGNWDWNIVTNELVWSDEIYRMFGLDPNEFGATYEAFLAAVHPEDRGFVMKAVDGALYERTPYSIDHRIVRPDAIERFVHEEAEVTFDPSGKPIRMIGTVQDITERKRAEEALREGEERMRTLIEASTDPVFFKDGDGRWLLINHSAAELFDLQGKEYRGKTELQLGEIVPFHREALAYCRSTDEDTWQTRNLSRSEETIPQQNAPSRVFDVVKVPLFEEDGRRRALVVIGRDITERKRAEQERQVLNAIGETVNTTASLDELLRSIHYNIKKVMDAQNCYIALYGASTETMSFPFFVDQFDSAPPPRAKRRGLTEYVLRTGKPLLLTPELLNELVRVGEVEIIGTVPKSWLGVPLLIESHPIGVLVVQSYEPGQKYTDREKNLLAAIGNQAAMAIERKRAEEKLREQASLLDITSDAVVVEDVNGRILFWNRGAERIYGWKSEEVIGTSARELLHADDPARFDAIKAAVIDHGEWRGEGKKVTKSGKLITVDSRRVLIKNEAGIPVSILIVSTDITEKKTLEAQFLRAQRLESLGTLAGGIAHDLNNVLAPILLAIEVLRKSVSDEKAKTLLTMLEANALRGRDIIKQVLTFARGIEGERTALQMRHLINDVGQIIKETFPKSIEVRIDVPRDLWTITGDATQLHQVLMNLCVNARDAMPRGGVLDILAENILLDEHYARLHADARLGPYVVVSITDSGTGISPENLDRIFEPFFTTKEVGKGTGLGLSTSLSIVKSHGGFVNAYSEVGKGSTFKVYIPAHEIVETDFVEKERIEVPLGNGELILVVDDEASVREITRQTLEMYGYRVVTASDGAEAMVVFVEKQREIKIGLIDMMMPVLDGMATIRALRRINSAVRIIAMSGLAANGRATIVEGSADFLLKPFSAVKLLKTLNKVLRESSV